MKTLLLTGATGYLGHYLSKKFLDKNYSLIALALNEKEIFRFKDNKNVKLYYLNKTGLEDIFKENNIDIIIHTATLYGRKQEQLVDMIRANVEFPVRILNLAIENNVSAFINTDTILSSKISTYALTKSQFAQWLDFYSDKIKCIDMKLDHFYGPNDNSVKFVAWLVEQFKNNVSEINLTEGSQTRDFIYIDDVVEAYNCILDNLDKIPVGRLNCFEIGTNNKTSIREFVETLKKFMNKNNKGLNTKLNFGAIPYRKNEVLDYDVDTTQIRMLGWDPVYNNVNKGLEKLVEENK